MNDAKIHALLQRLRNEYIQQEDDGIFCENQLFEIDGNKYKLNVWQDFYGANKLVVFQIKQSSILCTESFCLGVKYSAEDIAVSLTQEQLLDIGIP